MSISFSQSTRLTIIQTVHLQTEQILKSCRDVLKPVGVDKCTLTDYVDDCVSHEGLIDYVAFFFCAFNPDKMPLALFISVSYSVAETRQLLIAFTSTVTHLTTLSTDSMAPNTVRGYRRNSDRFVS